MHRLKILTAAAALLAATPAVAQGMGENIWGPDPYADGYRYGMAMTTATMTTTIGETTSGRARLPATSSAARLERLTPSLPRHSAR